MTHIAENVLDKYSSIGNADYEGIMVNIDKHIVLLSNPAVEEITSNFARSIDVSNFLLLEDVSYLIITFVYKETYKHLTYIDYKRYFDEMANKNKDSIQNSNFDEFNEILKTIRREIVTKYFNLNFKKSISKLSNSDSHNFQSELEYKYSTLKRVLSKQSLYKDNFYSNIALFSIVNQEVNKYCSNIFIDSTGLTIGDLSNKDLSDYIDILCNNIITNNEDINISLLSKYLIYYRNYKDTYTDLFNIVSHKYYTAKSNHNINSFEHKLTNKPIITEYEITIEDADLMSGEEFELLVGKLFSKIGYAVSYTKKSGDQGIDIIAEKQGIKIGIQAKRYTGTVSNSAIQEVVAGKAHYNCTKAIVVTNSVFTQSAIELANSNGVILWDRNLLKQKITESNMKYNVANSAHSNTTSEVKDQNTDLSVTDNIFLTTISSSNIIDSEATYYKKIATHAPINEYYNRNNPIRDKSNGQLLFNLSKTIIDESDKELMFVIKQLTDFILKYNISNDISNTIYEILSERGLDDDWSEITIKAYVNAVNTYLDRQTITKQEEHLLCEYIENIIMIQEFEEYLIATEKLYRMINKDSKIYDKNRFIRLCEECGCALSLGDDLFTTMPDKSIYCESCAMHHLFMCDHCNNLFKIEKRTTISESDRFGRIKTNEVCQECFDKAQLDQEDYS